MRTCAQRAGRRRCVVAGTAASLIALLGVLPVLAALAGSSVTGLAIQLAWTARSRRRRLIGEDASLDSVAALAAELRAGRPPPTALATVAEQRGRVPAAAPRRGGTDRGPGRGHPVGAPQADDGTGDLRRLAAAWQLSTSSGCSLAAILDAVDADLRARRQQRRLLSSLLSGPRATAGLLALLPALGLAMGAALGADPIHVLTSTGPGQLALVAGVGLDVAGVLWTARLVRSAQG
ncbi:MAG: pilus assembly protein TadB [Geodermatophilaceae bacterium]